MPVTAVVTAAFVATTAWPAAGSADAAAAAPLSWSGPIALHDDSHDGPNAVACPSVSQCTVVDNQGGEVTFDPSAPGNPSPTAIDYAAFQAVACPSAHQCTAVDDVGGEVTFDPTSGIASRTEIDPTEDLAALACPSETQCTAVDDTGLELTFDPISPGVLTSSGIGLGVDPDNNLVEGVACPSVSQCTVLDQGGQEVTFDPTAPGGPTSALLGHGSDPLQNGFGGLACPSANQCTAVNVVNGTGYEVTFNPTSPGNRTRAKIAPNATKHWGNFGPVACPSVSQCTALQTYGQERFGGAAVTFDPKSPGRGTTSKVHVPNYLYRLACASVSLCVALYPDAGAWVGRAAGSSSAAPRCSTAHLRLRFVDTQAAAGRRYVDYALENRGVGECSLRGYPKVVLLDKQGHVIHSAHAKVSHLPASPIRTVVIGSGKRAFFTFVWVNRGFCLASTFVFYGLRVSPPNNVVGLRAHLGRTLACDAFPGGVSAVRPKRIPF